MVNLLIGLGNTGQSYINTRHNVGFMLIDFISNQSYFQHYSTKLGEEYTSADNQLVLFNPASLMNVSGQAVSKYLKNKPKATTTYLAYDDLDLALGTFKIGNKMPKTHNGLYSVLSHNPNTKIVSIRIGIDARVADYKIEPASYVLSKFSAEENKILDGVFTQILNQLTLQS